MPYPILACYYTISYAHMLEDLFTISGSVLCIPSVLSDDDNEQACWWYIHYTNEQGKTTWSIGYVLWIIIYSNLLNTYMLNKLSVESITSHSFVIQNSYNVAQRKCILDWQVDCDDDNLIELLCYSTDWENQVWHLNLAFLRDKIINTLSITQQGLKGHA